MLCYNLKLSSLNKNFLYKNEVLMSEKKCALTKKFNTLKCNKEETRTKFGGQPDWIESPQWPLSQETGNPMKFIGQIDLSESVYKNHNLSGKMAYIFMTDEEDEFVDGTWIMDGGENAIIIQPCSAEKIVPLKNQGEGPTHSEIPYYLETELFPDLANNLDEDLDDVSSLYYEKVKLGGTPFFIQGEEFPEDEDNWFFLAQLSELPFEVNFGDQGTGYCFVTHDGTRGNFLWQCF
jgi:uncharacterized protein YwqG